MIGNPRVLDVLLAPPMWSSVDLGGQIVIVVDVLRATSAIVTALENGAEGVIAAASADEARAIAASLGQDAILAGEERSLPIPGFNRGNSPREFERDIDGRVVVLKTTNGTSTLLAGQGARLLLAMALLNVESTALFLEGVHLPITILLAGSSGAFNLEDALCAGEFVRQFRELTAYYEMSDAALACLRLAQWYDTTPEAALRQAAHGKALSALGLDDDLVACAQSNMFDTVALWRDGMLRRVTGHASLFLGAN